MLVILLSRTQSSYAPGWKRCLGGLRFCLDLFIYFICGCWNTFYLSGQPRAIILLPSFSAAQKKDEKAKYFKSETESFILEDSVK